jgi:hypothetical protein
MEIIKKIWFSERRVTILCVLLAFLPVILSLPGGLLGLLLGCSLNEGGTDACIRFGIPFGDLLYHSTVLPWFCLITMPVGFGGLVVWELWLKISPLFKKKE